MINDLKERFPNLPIYRNEIPDGWVRLTIDLFTKLDKIREENNLSKINIFQIKEKFAELRCYLDIPEELSEKSTKAISVAIREAEAESKTTCQHCGNPGKCGSVLGSWVSTKCYDCAFIETKKRYLWDSKLLQRTYESTLPGAVTLDTPAPGFTYCHKDHPIEGLINFTWPDEYDS